MGLETLRVVGACLAPFVPATAARLLEALDGGDGVVDARSVLEGVGTTGEDESGDGEMEVFWRRWNGREVKGVKLF